MAIESSAKAVAKLTDADYESASASDPESDPDAPLRLGQESRAKARMAMSLPVDEMFCIYYLYMYVYIYELFIDVYMDVCGINCTCLNMMIDNEREHLRFETMGWHRLYVISLSYSTCWGILMRRLKPWAELGSNKL